MLSAAALTLFLSFQSPTCADASSCRSAALEAQARKDYEAFHDLAWLAYRKGNPNDAELMLLLARAQSLSGRPSDALVMLQRIAARGVTTDAATSDDFARVRALSKWKELFGTAEEKSATAASEKPAPAAVDKPAAPAPSADKPSSPDKPATPDKPTSPPAKAAKPADPKRSAEKPEDAPAPKTTREPGAALTFTTLLTPSALAYDGVSRRYVIADRAAHRVAIVDENTGQVSTLAGAQAALGEIGGIAIDPTQGDLWVISATNGEAKLHRLQLISGRVVSTVPVTKGGKDPIAAMTFVHGAGLVAVDSAGALWRLSIRGRLERLGELEYPTKLLASDASGRVYVSPGGSKLARFSLNPRPGPREILTVPDDAVVDGGVAILGERLHFLSQRDGRYEIRTMSLKR